VAQSGESHGGEFTSAFGGAAEVHGRTAPIASLLHKQSGDVLG
jgi:hypothetical protein